MTVFKGTDATVKKKKKKQNWKKEEEDRRGRERGQRTLSHSHTENNHKQTIWIPDRESSWIKWSLQAAFNNMLSWTKPRIAQVDSVHCHTVTGIMAVVPSQACIPAVPSLCFSLSLSQPHQPMSGTSRAFQLVSLGSSRFYHQFSKSWNTFPRSCCLKCRCGG